METEIGIKHSNWDWNKSKYDDVDELPLVSNPIPILLILAAYLIFVLRLGPAMMKNKDGYKLKTTLLIYNGIQVIVSAYLVVRHTLFFVKTGLLTTKCQIADNSLRQEVLLLLWLYCVAKVLELFDTVFFVLRKKYHQVTFLHVYHHAGTMLLSWSVLKYSPADNMLVTGMLNSLVHVFMYAYYGLAAVPSLVRYISPWKKCITSGQIVQFLILIAHYLLWLRYSECPDVRVANILITCHITVILVLFGNFYLQSYTKKRPIQRNDDTGKCLKKE